MGKYGYITQPIESRISGLASLYLQGQEKVNAIRQNVREMRAENMMELGKKIDSIALTGIQDVDKMLNESGVLLRDRVMRAEAANRRGEISMSDYTRIFNNAMTEMGMIVNGNEVIGKNYETLQKRNADKEISGASLDLFQQGYIGGSKDYLNDPARYSILDDTPNGLAFTQYYTYTNSKGQRVAGTPISVPYANNMNPEFGNVAYFDPDAYAKSIRNQIGKKYGFFPDSFESLDVGGQGNFYKRVSEPQNVPMIRAHIEGFINSHADSDLIGVLYEGLGARAPYSSSYVKTLTEQEWTEKTYTPVPDPENPGKILNIPIYADKDGNGFTFTEDPFTLRHGEDGEIQLSDEQRELARGLLRSNAIAALNVDKEKYFVKNPIYKNTSGKAVDYTADFTGNPMFMPGPNAEAPVLSYIYGNARALSYERDVIKGIQKEDKLPSDILGVISNPAAYNWNSVPTGDGEWKKNNFRAFENSLSLHRIDTDEIESFNAEDGFIEHVDMGELTNKKDFPSLGLETFVGTPFETLQGVGFVKTSAEEGNAFIDRYAVVVSGTSVVGKTASKYTGKGGTQLQAGDETVAQAIGYVPPTQTVALLNALRRFEKFKNVSDKFMKDGKINVNNIPLNVDKKYHAAYVIAQTINSLK